MALFKPYKITSDKLEDLTIQEGQIIITTDTKKLYVDTSATERIEVTSEIDLSDYVTTSILTSTIAEEASERQKQDNLLEDLINTKLDTSSADNRYALKDYPELTGNAKITSSGWAGARIIGAHSNGEVADYYQYVIGFDLLHRPYIAKRENNENVSMIYLDTDKIVFNKPLAFTGSSGAEDYNAEASAQTRANIGAAAINHTHDVATTGTDGFMSAEDKTKLDGLENIDTSSFVTKEEADADYAAISHTHDDRYYTESEVDSKLSDKANVSHTHDDRYFTETEITDKLATKADTGHKHAASDVTSGTFALDRIPTITDAKIAGMSASKLTGTIPTANLPSYVDDVVEGATTEDFPETGEAGKIYVATSTNKTYRWSGSSYVEISASLALGTTSSTAFRGDYGNTAYQHATAKGAAFGSGLYKITTNAQGHVTAATAVTKNDITALGIPAQDTNTTYGLATTSANGLLRQLNGSTSSFMRGDGTWATPPNTTYNNMTGATTSAAGKAGLVPAPAAGAATRYLRSDGTWQVPPDTNTTYTLSSFGITATAAELNKLDGCTATVTELNYVDGVTSNIQTQLNGKAASSHTHSYLPLSGGTLTGTLTSRALTPSADSTYDIGTSTVRYRNIYTDSITASTINGTVTNATTATQANYWTTARTLTFTGDATGSVSIRGNANMSCALALAANSVTANEIASGAVGLPELGSAVGTVAVQSAAPTDSHVKLWIKV